MLELNTTLGAYVQQLINDILPTIIISQGLELLARCILKLGLQFSEFFTDFRLLFDKEDPCVPGKIIIKVITYLDPFMDVTAIGPLISECISPNMLVARFSFPRSNLCSGCFPITQPLQILVVALMTGRPSTMEFFYNFCKYLKLRWPNLSYHSLLTSFP